MNEFLFFFHILAVLICLALSLRQGQMALGIYVALTGVFANLFVVKQIKLFGMHATASDVFTIGGILGLNLLQELYGTDVAKKTIRASFFALLFFATMAFIHLLYAPSLLDQTHHSYAQILSPAPRIVLASISVYYLVQRFDLIFFSFLKRFIPRFGIRVILSLLVSQALDTLLFTFLGLYGLVASLFEVMVVSYIVKSVIILFSAPLAAFLRRFVSRVSV